MSATKLLIFSVLIFSVASMFAFSALADDLDRTCGNYRQSMNDAKSACARIKLDLDRGACVKGREVPATNAYAACVRSFNERGAAKTREKIDSGKDQKRQP